MLSVSCRNFLERQIHYFEEMSKSAGNEGGHESPSIFPFYENVKYSEF